MAHVRLTGPGIANYPGIVEGLKQKGIALRQVMCVEVTSEHGWSSPFKVMVTLRDGTTVPFTLTTIVYHPRPAITMHLNDVVTILYTLLTKKHLPELDAQELERVVGFLKSITYYEME